MTIRKFTPLGILIWVGTCALTYMTGFVPVTPVAIIAFFALTGIAFQVENGRLATIVRELLHAFADDRAHHHK